MALQPCLTIHLLPSCNHELICVHLHGSGLHQWLLLVL
jgi:hypothetical protein